MQASSPLHLPRTPSVSRPFQYRPLNSSPLADSPVKSSSLSARRKAQYKALAPTTPFFSRSSSSSRRTVSMPSCSVEADSQKAFLRDRLKARCIERAVKAREKAIHGKRSLSLNRPSSDDYQMEEDEEEDDEDIMQDELFRRIMADATRKQKHAYRVSYALDVGSSFDPDLEDISSWEHELEDPSPMESMAILSTSATSINDIQVSEHDILTPVDLDDEELEEYAEEYARRAAFADFENIPEDELFAWSDGEELGVTPTLASSPELQHTDYDSMDVS
ncbi:hypothetical protein CPB84DRAFT_1843423 [Gymnopilus junonius]|uniref:Uncharacterized protein n=1 Tax=Gymnopilus junonius TaxID=109634 RepID=A0A9P5NVV6_GYMJU|nr:hypothetical protein CPB84DRAFT_1843423 [Gymnopilus junonius]